MSEFFDAGRWWLLVRKHWFENRKKYTLSLITIGGLMGAFYLLYMIISGDDYLFPEFQAGIYFTGLAIACGLYASVIFSDLASKAKGISFITLPASQFEKFATAFFYVVVALPLMYTLFFYLFNTTALTVSNGIRYNKYLKDTNLNADAQGNKIEFHAAPLVNVLKYKRDSRYLSAKQIQEEPEQPNFYFYIWMALFAGQAFFSLGSVYFGRFSFVKTFISILLLMLFFYFLFLLANSIFSGEMFSYTKYDDLQSVSYSLPGWVGAVDIWLLEFALAPIFWIIANVRLKEVEI